jgi:hypothetical protein
MAMSSFEWMELQTLTSDIETARDRLADARKRRDHGRIRALEAEITQAEKRRLQLVAHISTNIATAPEPPPAVTGRPPAEAAAEPTEEAPAIDEATAVAESEMPAEATEEAGAEEVAAPAAAEPPAAEEPEIEPEPTPRRRAKEAASAGEEPVVAADQPEAEAPPPEPQFEVAAAAASSASAPKATSPEGGITVWDQLTPNDIERAKRDIGVRRAEMLARHADELKALEAEQGQIDVLEQAIASFLTKFNAAAEGAVVKLDQERELRQQGSN